MSHVGQNIARLRGIRRMTQKELAGKLNLTQPEYSRLEQKEEVDEDLLRMIAEVLEVSPEAIKSFDEAALINNINCTFQDNAVNTVYQFNPMDKIVQLYETVIREKDEIIKSKDEVIAMYRSQQKAS